MVGGLARARVAFRRIADDAEGRLVGDDLDGRDLLRGLEQLRMGLQQRHEAFECAGRLMLVEAELEVHAHDGEVAAGMGEDEVEGRSVGVSGCWFGGLAGPREQLAGPFECAEDRLRVAEDVARTGEAAHGALHRHHGDLGAQGGGGAFGVRELLARSDGPPGDVMGHDHADGRLDLLGGGAEHRAVGGGARDRAVNHVVDRVRLQAEDFGEPTADLVVQDHPPQGEGAVSAGKLGRGDGHGVVVVVAELAGGVAEGGVEAEVRSVGVPFAHGRAVGDDRFLGRDGPVGAEDGRPVGMRVRGGLLAEDRGGVGAQRDRGEAADHAVCEEHQGALEDRRVGRAP